MTTYFTIIIPVRAINNYIRETVPYIQSILKDYAELIILPNEQDIDEWHDSRISIVASGKVGPAKKRDMGAELAQGKILVFLDDDSYPDLKLLEIAKPYFGNSNIVALGGPAITPKNDDFWQKVSGAMFLSRFSGGTPERYLSIGKPRIVYDWPSVNLMVRKDDFIAIGGFNSIYWPGEDTKLCLDLITKTSKQILYVPEMLVWHHRRAGLFAHLKQIGGYGLHRGYFARKYPATSRKPLYFIPSVFVIFVTFSIIVPFSEPYIFWFFFLGWSVYVLVIVKALCDIRKYETTKVAMAASVYILFSHLWYGLRFIQGFLTKKIISRLR